ncbi:MAG: translation elongation factor Ts [Patescibacteria group bacterium]
MDNSLVVKLRAMTGAGMVDCKKALEETNGDLDKAADLLRRRGELKAAKKSERAVKSGLIHGYIHGGGGIGAMVEVLCETDFVARNPDFQELVHDLAMQVAAENPLYLSPEDVPVEVVEKEKEFYLSDVAGKPAEIAEKIMAGKLQKYFSEVCLMKQQFIKDEDLTVEELIKNKIAVIGENIQVKRFMRYALGGKTSSCDLER